MATLRKSITTFDYDDVRLLPKECIITSRSETTVTTRLGNREFALPVVPANMSTIMSEELGLQLAKRNQFYVMHRFDNDPVQLVKNAQEQETFSSISVGVQPIDYKNLQRLKEANLTPDYITIDIAHGHAKSVIKMTEAVKNLFPTTYVIAGNVGTAEGAIALENAGADGIKAGIGPGMACSTSPNTGFGTNGWQLSAIEQVADSLQKASVIADGGIRHTGDIAKSVAFGADMVMVGGMFGGHDENPGKVIEGDDGNLYKEFFGSASEHQKGEKKHVEGKRLLVPYKGSIWDTFNNLKENLQSSVSYAGGTELEALRHVDYVLI